MTSSITCPRCGRTSHNPNDVRERYCGACHVFHGDAHPALAPYAVEVFRLDGGGLVATFPFRSFDEAHAGMRRLAQERRGEPDAEGYQVVRTDAPPGSTGLTRDEQERADALSEALGDLAEVASPSPAGHSAFGTRPSGVIIVRPLLAPFSDRPRSSRTSGSPTRRTSRATCGETAPGR